MANLFGILHLCTFINASVSCVILEDNELLDMEYFGFEGYEKIFSEVTVEGNVVGNKVD